MSKIGLHLVFGSRTGYGDFLRETVTSDNYHPVIKCVGDFAPARQAKAVFGDRVLTIGRMTSYGWEGFDDYASSGSDPMYIASVAEYTFNTFYRPQIEAHPEIDVWEPSNEWSAYWEWQALWYGALSPFFISVGARMGIYACSTGNPPDSAYPTIARCAKLLQAQNAGHILTLHEYGLYNGLKGSDPDLALRYRRLYQYLIEQDAVIPLVLSETGQGNGSQFVGVDAFISDYEWYDDFLMRDDYVLGCAAWTLGNWASANFQQALPALAQYILAHPQPIDLSHKSYLPLVQSNHNDGQQDVTLLGASASILAGATVFIISRRMRKRKST